MNREAMIQTTMNRLNISREQAEMRMEAMFQSKILYRFDSPEDALFAYTVDMALRIPQLIESEVKNG